MEKILGKNSGDGETIGNVLRIEKTSMYDGAGLRTVVFLKGCPLRCLWCSTPESQSSRTQISYNRDRCTLCGLCAVTCPAKALRIGTEDARIFRDTDRCTGCLACVRTCPNSALTRYGTHMTAKDVLREIEKDEVFYFHSGGGMTVSGGEPLKQTTFVENLLTGCKKLGIHRAIETSFFSPWERIERILSLLDLVYVDLKHTDPEKHRKITGADNAAILENIKRADASSHNFEMILRIPIIPGLNDSNAAMESSARFIKNLRRVKSVELLAYHRLGTETYRNLDVQYQLPDLKTPSKEHLLERARILCDISGASILVGGETIKGRAG